MSGGEWHALLCFFYRGRGAGIGVSADENPFGAPCVLLF